MESFAGLGVNTLFIDKLSSRNIHTPTAIQCEVIPPLLAGKNVLFRSATGTGKTFAYLIPMFQRIVEQGEVPRAGGESPGQGSSGHEGAGRSGPLMCVCAPTYELCSQIKGEADFLLAGSSLRASLLIGSANMGRQIEGLKKNPPQVIIGNPGRLLQLARMGKLKLGRLRYLVLDEGDRLTAEELFEETRGFTGLLGPRRLSASCSATIPAKNRERLMPLLGEAVEVRESEDREILRERIEHWAFFSEGRRKIDLLRSFLAAARPRKALVFTDRGGQVGNIVSKLQYGRVKAAGLYGDMDKKARRAALEDFRGGRAAVLVSSDLAARGLDIPEISHVIALDSSPRRDDYVHRAGRTGRAGRRGIMVTIGDEEELRSLAVLEKKLGIVVYPKILWEGRVCAPD
jgi:superfamily II DNA/RNA helicase